MSITQVCRQTYIESRTVPFANASFLMSALDKFTREYAWLPTQPIEQHDAITSIIIPLTLYCHWKRWSGQYIAKLSSEEQWTASSKRYAIELQWFARFMEDIDKMMYAIIWAALNNSQKGFLGSTAEVRSVVKELIEEGCLKCDADLVPANQASTH